MLAGAAKTRLVGSTSPRHVTGALISCSRFLPCHTRPLAFRMVVILDLGATHDVGETEARAASDNDDGRSGPNRNEFSAALSWFIRETACLSLVLPFLARTGVSLAVQRERRDD